MTVVYYTLGVSDARLNKSKLTFQPIRSRVFGQIEGEMIDVPYLNNELGKLVASEFRAIKPCGEQ